MRLPLLAVVLTRCLVVAVEPIVKLDYASYQGQQLRNGVSQWLGIRYGKSPTGDLRFAAPVIPDKEVELQNATSVCSTSLAPLVHTDSMDSMACGASV